MLKLIDKRIIKILIFLRNIFIFRFNKKAILHLFMYLSKYTTFKVKYNLFLEFWFLLGRVSLLQNYLHSVKNCVKLRRKDFVFFNSVKDFKHVLVFLNKMMLRGEQHIINKIFFNLMWSNRSLPFYYFFLESLYVLEPGINVKILKFKKKGKRSVKKGKKVPIKVKVIPEKINTEGKGFKIVLKWIVSSIRINSKLSRKMSIISEIKDIVFNKKCGTVKQRKSFHKLAYLNKSAAHFRWKKKTF